MAVVANRRSVMTLFSRPTDIHSHRARLVLVHVDFARREPMPGQNGQRLVA